MSAMQLLIVFVFVIFRRGFKHSVGNSNVLQLLFTFIIEPNSMHAPGSIKIFFQIRKLSLQIADFRNHKTLITQELLLFFRLFYTHQK